MKYYLVASSRSRTTEIFQSENGKLVQVFHYKSGREEYTPTSKIPSSLTIRYKDSDEYVEIEGDFSQAFITPTIK